MSSEEPYFRQFYNLAREEMRHLRSNGAMGTLKPRFTRTSEKLGKPGSQSWRLRRILTAVIAFLFGTRDLRRPESRGGKVNKRSGKILNGSLGDGRRETNGGKRT